MDLQLSPENLPRGPWTNEKHLRFLNTMEASFVRTMLQNNAVSGAHHLRLDRYLPDTSDSTLDLKSHRRNKRLASSPGGGDIGVGPITNTVEPNNNNNRRLSTRRLFHRSSQDQAVPQLEDRSGDKDEAVTSMASAS